MMDPRDRVRAAMARQGRWYDVHNAAADVAVVRIYDEISWWGVSADEFAADIAAITAGTIEVQINSPGGNVFDGLAIYNALRLHPARIVTRVDGLAASAASVIAQAGDHRIMVSSSQMMIHEAWGVAVGNAADMLDMATLLEQQNTVLAELYAERSGGDVDNFRQMMATETWFTAQAAVDAGLADEVLVPARQDAPSNKIADAVASSSAAEPLGFDPALSLALLDL
jgi:ATP-dependent Clp endopeptidase proteolytic subunit ClpP